MAAGLYGMAAAEGVYGICQASQGFVKIIGGRPPGGGIVMGAGMAGAVGCGCGTL